MTIATPREPWWWSYVRLLVLVLPIAVATVVLQESGVSAPLIVAIHLFSPLSAALVPYFARRWYVWGSAFCLMSLIGGMLALVKIRDWSLGAMMGMGILLGVVAVLLGIVAARIAKRRTAQA